LILFYGDRKVLEGRVWYLLELSSDKTVQSIMKRVGKAIPSIFRDQSIEIFLPVFERDLDEFDMRTGNYIFARSTGLTQLLRLKTITGIVGIVTEGECNRPSKAILVEDDYVQQVMCDAKKAFDDRILGIKVGSFVRILDGETRDYCGKVTVIHDGKAAVQVELKTKLVIIETPLRNLINLPHVPPEQQVFYYGPLVKEMMDEQQDNGRLLVEDLEYEDEIPVEVDIPLITDDINHHSRQKTITALAKRLVFEGITEPVPLAARVITAIKAHEVKAPKNLFIVYCLPSGIVMQSPYPFFTGETPQTDIVDLKGDIRTILSTIERPYSGDMVTLHMKGNLSFRCTPEHEILVLRPTTAVFRIRGRLFYKENKRLLAKNPLTPMWVTAESILPEDYLLTPNKLPKQTNQPGVITNSSHHLAQQLPSEVQPDPDLAWLFGLYIADGGTLGDYGFNICLNTRTDQNRVKSAFEKLGIPVQFDKHPQYTYANVSSVTLTRTFRSWFGRDCYEKHIPPFLLGWNMECLQQLVSGIAEGDGLSNLPGRQLLYTTSLKLAYQMRQLLVALGCYPCLTPVPIKEGATVTIGKYVSKIAPAWQLWWTDSGVKTYRHDTNYYEDYYCMRVTEVEREFYEGTVYNYSVEETETYVANGIVAHNCVLKSSLMDNHFTKIDPTIKNYRDVIHKFGKSYKFSANDIAEIDPELGIPVTTIGVCNDGRSREARLKKLMTASSSESETALCIVEPEKTIIRSIENEPNEMLLTAGVN